jgi:hypothetical protein
MWTSSFIDLTDSPMTHSDDSVSTSAPTIWPLARASIVTIAAGLTAAMITWAAGESLMIEEIGRGSRGGRTPISPVVDSTRNGVTCFGILGGSLGLALGLAGGFQRTPRPSLDGPAVRIIPSSFAITRVGTKERGPQLDRVAPSSPSAGAGTESAFRSDQ